MKNTTRSREVLREYRDVKILGGVSSKNLQRKKEPLATSCCLKGVRDLCQLGGVFAFFSTAKTLGGRGARDIIQDRPSRKCLAKVILSPQKSKKDSEEGKSHNVMAESCRGTVKGRGKHFDPPVGRPVL